MIAVGAMAVPDEGVEDDRKLAHGGEREVLRFAGHHQALVEGAQRRIAARWRPDHGTRQTPTVPDRAAPSPPTIMDPARAPCGRAPFRRRTGTRALRITGAWRTLAAGGLKKFL
jgi:hypothetical protein